MLDIKCSDVPVFKRSSRIMMGEIFSGFFSSEHDFQIKNMLLIFFYIIGEHTRLGTS